MSAQEAVSDRFYSCLYQSLLHPGLPKSRALPQFLGLLFQAVKADVSSKRAAAFAKRLLQVAVMQPPNVACGALLVLSEILKHMTTLWPALTNVEDIAGAEAQDVLCAEDSESDAEVAIGRNRTQDNIARAEGEAVWPHAENYDMHKRSPQFARAESACLWEMLPLAQHMHPSVSTMAHTLLAGASIIYDGDPLKDLTLLAFLDKFVKRCVQCCTCCSCCAYLMNVFTLLLGRSLRYWAGLSVTCQCCYPKAPKKLCGHVLASVALQG
jgi:ribosome biogenesis protein MAK21